MIKFFRVDHRLLHGQVALSWYGSTGSNCILIANDDVPNNPVRKSAMKLAKPAGSKLVIQTIEKSKYSLNNGVTDKYKLFIVVSSIHDAFCLIKGIKQNVTALNLGGTAKTVETEPLSATINVTEKDKKELKELQDAGVEISIQQVPTEAKKIITF